MVVRLLTMDELAQEWRCKREAISKMVHEGMPHVRVEDRTRRHGCRLMFDLKACQVWYRGVCR